HFLCTPPAPPVIYTLSLHDALPIFGNCCRDISNGAELRGQVCRQAVNVVGQIPPCACGAGHVCLAAELSFDAHFARHGGNLVGEDRKSTRLNSSHVKISYAVFCLKK